MNNSTINHTIHCSPVEAGPGFATTTQAASPFAMDPPLSRRRGPVTDAAGRTCIGRVGAPAGQEATSGRFYFWVPSDCLVEKTQLVTCHSEIAGRSFTFYAIVDEVHRCSRKRSIGHEVDEADGDLSYTPAFDSEGCTYASASILRTEPPLFTPPRERSQILLASPQDASLAYRADENEHGLKVGLIKNGGDQMAGPGEIDLNYLLGVNGGHMNVNGTAGRGTKSSFLLFMNWLLLHEARRQQVAAPSAQSRLRIVPIILNVKNFDLFHIDRRSSRYKAERHLADWQALGISDPQPFRNVSFFAAQQAGNTLAVPTGRSEGVRPYSWSLRDVISRGLFPYLFAEVDANDANFGALVLDIENWLTADKVHNDGSVQRSLQDNRFLRDTFGCLLEWIDDQAGMEESTRALRNHHTGTWKKLHRRLLKIIYQSAGVIRRDDETGHPLDVVRADTTDPIVVDLAALAQEPELQRFVVATVLRQLVDARTGSNAVRGLVYLVTLDELNRFAPRGARDPITQLIEVVAAEMRSQGVILMGAQQQASKVSEKVIENSALRVLGKSGTLELSATVWRFLSDSARQKAETLQLDEKLIVQDNFREPMHVRVPFPVWAMNPNEALPDAASAALNGSAHGRPPEVDDLSDIIDG